MTAHSFDTIRGKVVRLGKELGTCHLGHLGLNSVVEWLFSCQCPYHGQEVPHVAALLRL